MSNYMCYGLNYKLSSYTSMKLEVDYLKKLSNNYVDDLRFFKNSDTMQSIKVKSYHFSMLKEEMIYA